MSENDPELEARWRAASREQPPAALDDAIRAAARREVGARPGGFSRASRWVPLAAAATVGVIAVGIVQMTPPEQVTPTAITNATKNTTDVATDAIRRDAKPDAAQASGAQPPREAQVAPAAPEVRKVPQERAPAAKPIAKEQRQGAVENDRGALTRNRSDGFAAAPRDQLQEQERLASRQAVPQRMEEAAEREQALKQKAELAAAAPAARPSAAASPPPTPMARNEIQPFPAVPAPAPARSSVANAPPPMVAAPPASAPAAAGAPAIGAQKLTAQSSATGSLPGHIAGGGTGNAGPAPAQEDAALEKKSAAMADKVTADRSKDLAPLSPDEWIKRIRRLIVEGRNEDAQRELAAFRREYKERSEALLPGDLRTFKR